MAEEALARPKEPAQPLTFRIATELEFGRVVNHENARPCRSPLGRRDEVRLENRFRLDSAVAEEPIRRLELRLVRQCLREALRGPLRKLVRQPVESAIQPLVAESRTSKLL